MDLVNEHQNNLHMRNNKEKNRKIFALRSYKPLLSICIRFCVFTSDDGGDMFLWNVGNYL